MSRKIFDGSPVEPAHPVLVQLHDDLVTIYRLIREKFQTKIDEAFDQASRQIGFLVTTTIPYVLEVGDKGAVKRVAVGAEYLEDTIFDRELGKAVKGLSDATLDVTAGTYRLYMIWCDALKLRLRTEWMEPAHYHAQHMGRAFLSREWVEPAHFPTFAKTPVERVRPEVMEPAHWFHPGMDIASEEKVLISVIDEVYPELQLVDRVIAVRQIGAGKFWPGIREPAHFRRSEVTLEPENSAAVLSELATVLRRFGY